MGLNPPPPLIFVNFYYAIKSFSGETRRLPEKVRNQRLHLLRNVDVLFHIYWWTFWTSDTLQKIQGLHRQYYNCSNGYAWQTKQVIRLQQTLDLQLPGISGGSKNLR